MAMKFNFFVRTFVMLAMGMSVEFTCHLAAAMSNGVGDAETRIQEAMAHCFPALFEGTMSTLICALPLGIFGDRLFLTKYFFTIVVYICLFGGLNGFVIMPSILACGGKIKDKIAPPSETKVAPADDA